MRSSTLTTPNTGITLNYRIWDGSGPPLILIHGLASTLRIWDFVAPILGEKYTVVAYDQRGHAFSDKPDAGYDLVTEVEDLRDLVQTLNLRKPIVIGHSWGATLALGYAAAYPDDCAGVALIDGGLMNINDRPGATWEQVSKELAPPDLSKFKMDDLLGWARKGQFSELSEDYLREYFGSMMEVRPDGTIRARLSRDNHLKILRTMWDTSLADLLVKIKCPVLIIMALQESAGEREAMFLEAKRRGVAQAEKLLPDAKVIWMENTIHDIPLQRPEELAREILDFAEGL